MDIKRKPEFENNKDVDALERLIKIAFEDSHQCKYVRNFLLHLYNHLKVMVMQANERKEPHNYFINGREIFKHIHALSKDRSIILG